MENIFLNSKEAMKLLKISSCELCHIRIENKVRFKKKGNGYYYLKSDLDLLKK